MSMYALIGALFTLYIIITGVFVILENRRPQSTYSWLLAFSAVPVLSVLLYFFTGRGWKAFSQQKELARNAIGDKFIETLKQTVSDPNEIAQRLSSEHPAAYNPALMRLVAITRPQC